MIIPAKTLLLRKWYYSDTFLFCDIDNKKILPKSNAMDITDNKIATKNE